MGSWTITNKLNTSFQRDEPGPSCNLNKTKQNYNSVNSSLLDIWDSVRIVSGCPSAAHSLSAGLQLAPLPHCYCSWWSSHGTDISKRLGSLVCLALPIHHSLSSALQSEVQPWPPLNTASVCWLWGNTAQKNSPRCCCSPLIPPPPESQSQLTRINSQQGKGFTSVVAC